MFHQLGLILLAIVIFHCNATVAVADTAPENVQLEVIDSYTVRMRWDPPPRPGGRIINYHIFWRLNNSWQQTIIVPPVTNYTFERLKPQQTIAAQISAYTKSGDGDEHTTLHSPSAEVKQIITTVRSTRSYTFNNLKPGTTVRARVSAHSRPDGRGERDFFSPLSSEAEVITPLVKGTQMLCYYEQCNREGQLIDNADIVFVPVDFATVIAIIGCNVWMHHRRVTAK
ncbi:unnamed protein product [Hydatigera taeniaeformis]|uniref:Fibronectin type-III domain-containing protein n=1 Tax=Hydatigena taeniaeformis TaxID=6205 RepID=A0A0R3WJU7_HYDTA|nr:unnamed protein product [Hydatigera taeniaeformis]